MTSNLDHAQRERSAPGADVVTLRSVPTPPTRLGLVGASDLVRHGLQAMLEPRAAEVQLVDEADLRPSDLVLVDVHSTAPIGPRHVSRLVGQGFTAVWAYGWGSTAPERERLRDAGARGYLSMRHEGDRLVGVLHVSATRQPLTSAPKVSRTARPMDLEDLSPRELDVVTLVCRALTNTEIAAELFISVNTIKTLIRSAYRKIGVTTRSQCMLWGIERGL